MKQITVPFSEKAIEIVANEYAGRVSDVKFLGFNKDYFYSVTCEIPLLLVVVDGGKKGNNRQSLLERLERQNQLHLQDEQVPLPICDKFGEFVLQLVKGEQTFFVLAYMTDSVDYWADGFIHA